MLYVFQIGASSYVKMGFATRDPWSRACDGFWRQIHPSECCNSLGWEHLELLLLAPGSMSDEASIKLLIPPVRGEFWPREQLEALTAAIKDCNADSVMWQLPLPDKPIAPLVGRGVEKRVCCGGDSEPMLCVRSDVLPVDPPFNAYQAALPGARDRREGGVFMRRVQGHEEESEATQRCEGLYLD